jgi:hypothetical protein
MFRSGAKHAQKRLLLENTGAGRFRSVGPLSGPGFAGEAVGRTVVAGDIDNDGDLDLLVTNNGGPAELLRNDGGSRSNAILLRLVGGSAGRTTDNRDAIGARVRLTSGARTQVREATSGSSYLGQNDPRVHFGIGAATSVDRLEIRWPSGRTELLQHVPANHVITVREGDGVVSRAPFER